MPAAQQIWDSTYTNNKRFHPPVQNERNIETGDWEDKHVKSRTKGQHGHLVLLKKMGYERNTPRDVKIYSS